MLSCLAVIFGLKLLVFPNYTVCLSIDDEFVHYQSDSSNKVSAMDEVQMYQQKVFYDTVASHCYDNN